MYERNLNNFPSCGLLCKTCHGGQKGQHICTNEVFSLKSFSGFQLWENRYALDVWIEKKISYHLRRIWRISNYVQYQKYSNTLKPVQYFKANGLGPVMTSRTDGTPLRQCIYFLSIQFKSIQLEIQLQYLVKGQSTTNNYTNTRFVLSFPVIIMA